MQSTREITIYGAGMSGLVAAINLAREGYAVTVCEREKGFGGDASYNPSTHTTPILPGKVSKYICIDITPVFKPLIDLPFYFHNTRVQFPTSGMYAVERGDRSTSLDALLYPMACDLGVRFEFNTPLKKEAIPALAPGTIIACGLTPEVYDMLAIPYRKIYGWISRGTIGFDRRTWVWIDECVTEYGYLSSVNNYYFDLLFSFKPISAAALERYKDFMKCHQGVEHDTWEYITGAVPVADPTNPQLVRGGHICCGTISGFMDPIGLFGITGAMISGKIAAMAVSDMDSAQREFARFSKNFKTALFIKNYLWSHLIRPHVTVLEKTVTMIGPPRLATTLASLVREDKHLPILAIPGHAHLGVSF
jgi:flavin-dependent dehydrogenase